MRGVLLVALGGALGAMARYGVALWLGTFTHRFPLGTLAVNLLGSFLIGLALPALLNRPAAQLMLVTGFLGGFTTFSAFSLETLTLLQTGRQGAALLYVSLSVIGGLLFAALGYAVGRWLALPQP